ncbi:MAG TPA: tRNA uridine-5-carboxymethylaminomethyl(34) synthesis GTPase MnmE [Candidatus Polarisedimenticolia bacterium]|nr:tRNA uridine-5-carboxymethylaminomethyl(34) synthesis GTPase MnmE [Candidatus Polarisedimenticolia bacterium]
MSSFSPWPPEETIVALSTPPGRAGIAVIRISGPDALACARAVFRMRANARIEPHRAVLGRFVGELDSSGLAEEIDTGYLTWHPEGLSFTGQEIAELSCHSSPPVIERLLAALLAAGAKAAGPGEFTYRAVLSGRLDLVQAEGIRDLIDAETSAAARLARERIRGDLSRRLGAIGEELVEVISRAEASLEFAEEPDASGAGDALPEQIRTLERQVRSFVASYRRGRLMRDGATVALAGRVNAGKSSLFNRLLGAERAIVSEQPGTTRDFVSEKVDLDGFAVTFIDTAGLSDRAAGIESEGVRRSEDWIGRADLVVVLVASDRQPDAADRRLLDSCAGRSLAVASKSDLSPSAGCASPRNGTLFLPVSARTGRGVDELRSEIRRTLCGGGAPSMNEVLITDARHHEALRRCGARLTRAVEALSSGATEEIALVDLYAALNHLGEITGAVTQDDIYARIFSTFCIGK